MQRIVFQSGTASSRGKVTMNMGLFNGGGVDDIELLRRLVYPHQAARDWIRAGN